MTQAPCATRSAQSSGLREAPIRPVRAREQGFMLATLADRAPEGPDWLFEIKYDGVRVLAERRGDAVTLLGRSGQVVTARYPEIVAALRALAFDQLLIDGEIVALDARGVPSFQRLQARMGLTRPGDVARAMAAVPVEAVFFDCLALEGHDLRRVPLAARKGCLQRVLPPLGVTRYGDHVEGAGAAFLEAAAEARLEGILAKRAASTYVARRSDAWLKIKCHRRQEFVIGGYTEPQGSRARFGALHIGVYDGGRLVYVSKVGTGFDGAELERLWQRLEPLRRDSSPFDAGTPDRTRTPLGRATARLRGAVHRLDAGWGDPPSDLPRAPGRLAPPEVPPRGAGPRRLGRRPRPGPGGSRERRDGRPLHATRGRD